MTHDDHLTIGAYESRAATTVTSWEQFVGRCEKLCAKHLRRDSRGNPTFDGDDDVEGYSLDWLHDQFEAGKRPIDVIASLLWRINGLHRA